jgi:arylsulfatase A-like enzyme/Tfp pilus assembly protein PilF
MVTSPAVRKLLILITIALVACAPRKKEETRTLRPSILLVTLDTTRADALTPAIAPEFNKLAARGRLFRFAYTAVPQTLPSHTSMMTGLYPAGHGVRENARAFTGNQPVIAKRVHAAGYRTAAFVSAFALARRFGLGRGFDVYDDDFGANAERTAAQTTERVIAYLKQPSSQPAFVWVHYYDPHFPYTPPEPYRSRYSIQPYFGEVASMDEQLGKLVAAFEASTNGNAAIIISGDHGEGLGEHGEAQHGNLLYQATVHIPLLIIGPGVDRGTSDVPVSARRIFHTIADWAGLGNASSLRGNDREIVAGEAMKPFLDYGWQPQVMAVDGNHKAILAGTLEVYDVAADPHETHNLAQTASLSREARATLQQYPIPTLTAAASAAGATNISEEDWRKLASLGYVASDVKPVVRADAPRPADMAALFPMLDEAATLFVREEYTRAIVLLEQIEKRDPHNLDAILRLATAHSTLGHNQEALAAFQRAQAIAPDSPDVRTYLALHYARGKDWKKAEPMLDQIVAQSPDRVPALEALALIREREGRATDAIKLFQHIYALRAPSAAELLHLGALAMQSGQTDVAIDAYEKARSTQGESFRNDLELGVLYLAAGRLEEARNALDRVPASSAAYPMALFKRAQVSVLLREPDAPSRIDAARAHANNVTRELIARERLFQ